uniref:Uncharacterized protein n=1 Tax=Arundo donax TaxID=35708 RepID=A0A0A9TTK6_ARUDO
MGSFNIYIWIISRRTNLFRNYLFGVQLYTN